MWSCTTTANAVGESKVVLVIELAGGAGEPMAEWLKSYIAATTEPFLEGAHQSVGSQIEAG
jgi:hypothetical protein